MAFQNIKVSVRCISCTLLFAVCVMGVPVNHKGEIIEKPKYDLTKAEELFEEFLTKHNKVYDDKEHSIRLEHFRKNLKEINELNERFENVAYAINSFTDLTDEEILKKITGFKWNSNSNSTTRRFNLENLPKDVPESFDWRDKKVVTSVKSQGDCGACWAFSAMGNIESQYALHKGQGKHVDLSEQDAFDCISGVDCDHGYDPDKAFIHLMKQGGVMLEQDYPYIEEKGSCKFDMKKVVKDIKIVDHKLSLNVNEEILKKILVQNGPLSIGMNGKSMLKYHAGIDHPTDVECDPNVLNHAVILVGYGVGSDAENKMKYWIIKNSWGASYGEEGYYRIERGRGACAVNSYISSVTLQ